MSDFSGYTEEQIMEWMLKSTDTDSAPSNMHVSLHTADEGNNPDGSEEVDASDYDRVSTSSSDWTVQSGDGPVTVENENDINFGDPDNNWGTITHFCIWDGSSDSDNPLIRTVSLDESKTVDSDTDELLFEAGDLTVSAD